MENRRCALTRPVLLRCASAPRRNIIVRRLALNRVDQAACGVRFNCLAGIGEIMDLGLVTCAFVFLGEFLDYQILVLVL